MPPRDAAAPPYVRQPARTPALSLTAAGAVIAMALLTTLGAALDILTGPGLGIGAGIGLSVSTALAAWVVRRSGRFVVLVAPPLIFVVVCVLSILVLSRVSLTAPSVATRLVYGFPSMGIATVIGAIVAVLRSMQHR